MSTPEVILTGGLSAGLLTMVLLYVLVLRRNTALINKLAEIAAKYVQVKKQADELDSMVKQKNEYLEKMERELAGLADASQLVAMYRRLLSDSPVYDNRATLPDKPSPK